MPADQPPGEGSAESTMSQHAPLALPPPPAESDAQKLDISSAATTLKFDDLGPMVVNSDGTLSRITNWQKMTTAERERTMRVLNARNKLRIENEEKKQGKSEEEESLSISQT